MSILSFMKAGAAEALHELLGDTFTYGQARAAGLSDRRLYGLRDAGQVIALGGGVYRWADAPPADDDLVEIAERVPRATLCLETALARHGLIDAIPAAIDIAVPRGSTRPALRAPCRLHQFDARTFDLEREPLDVGARQPLGLYTAERSIIDAIRLRHREGSDLAWQALRRWLNQPGSSPARLTELARRFPQAEPALRQALAVLL
jgi:predicted transcriptional regulator of viral defense system